MQQISEAEYQVARRDDTCVLCGRDRPARWKLWYLLVEPWVACPECHAGYCRHCRRQIETKAARRSTFVCMYCRHQWEFSYRYY